jgi:hypothetical protein
MQHLSVPGTENRARVKVRAGARAIANTLISFSSRLTLTLTLFVLQSCSLAVLQSWVFGLQSSAYTPGGLQASWLPDSAAKSSNS